MGYLTNYKIQVYPASLELIVFETFEETAGYSMFEEGNNCINAKWYNHETECAQVSKAIPEVLLILDGSGEERGDIWRKAWYAGNLVFDWRLDLKAIVPHVPQKYYDLANKATRKKEDYDEYVATIISMLTPEQLELVRLIPFKEWKNS